MLFKLVPGGFAYGKMEKKYWDLETCRKSKKKVFELNLENWNLNIFSSFH